MLYAYADQNFLSYCVRNPAWRDTVVRAKKSGTACLVLSPLHFLEVGRSDSTLRESLLRLAEDTQPCWTYTQADMQKRECMHIWNWFWGNGTTPFHAIRTLHEAAAAMHNVHPSRVAKFTLQDWVAAFVTKSGDADPLDVVWESMDEQQKAATSNRRHYQRGRMTPEVLRQIDRRHIAIQMARETRDKDRVDVYSRAEQLLQTQPLATLIDTFIYWQGMKYLKCYQVESALTTNLWAGEAKLGPSRLVDRQHAAVALPFCDRFVTDDRDLTRRCEVAKQAVKFQTAEVQKGEAFIASL